MGIRRIVAVSALLAALAACGGGTTKDAKDASSNATTTTLPGKAFTDPQGTYKMRVDPSWTASFGTITADVEAWFVGDRVNGFTPNVNVLTQKVPHVALSDYIDLSIRQGPRLMDDNVTLDHQIVAGPDGKLGLIEYTGSQAGHALHFLAYVSLHGGNAVVATFTDSAEEFARARPSIEPYLRTLQAI